jgi:hypothetical protein
MKNVLDTELAEHFTAERFRCELEVRSFGSNRAASFPSSSGSCETFESTHRRGPFECDRGPVWDVLDSKNRALGSFADG